MPGAGQLRDRLTFQQRGLDANDERTGDWNAGADEFTRSAQLTYLRGGEAVQEQRLQGQKPVVITVRADSATGAVTSAWRAVNPRKPTQIFSLTSSATPAKERGFFDILAVEDGRAGG